MTISHRYFPHPRQELAAYTVIAVPSLGSILYYNSYSIDVPFTFYLPSLLLCTLARRSILPMNIHYAPASHHHVGNWTSSLRLFTQHMELFGRYVGIALEEDLG